MLFLLGFVGFAAFAQRSDILLVNESIVIKETNLKTDNIMKISWGKYYSDSMAYGETLTKLNANIGKVENLDKSVISSAEIIRNENNSNSDTDKKKLKMIEISMERKSTSSIFITASELGE